MNEKYYEFEGSSTSPDAYKIGDTETIYYDPENPEDQMPGTFMDIWFIPVFCGGFFIVLLTLGITTLIRSRTSGQYSIR